LYMFYYYCGRRQLMSQLSVVKKFQRAGIVGSVLLILLAVAVLADVLYIIYNNSNRYYIWLFAVSYILALGATVKQIGYALCKRIQEKLLIKFHPLMFLLLLGVLAYPLSRVNLTLLPVCGIIAAFSACCLLFPTSFCRFFYKINWLQEVDGFGFFYETLVNSARLLGRFLLLLVDRLFIEKFVVKLTASLAQANIRFFRKINNTTAAVILVFLVTTALLTLSYKLGGLR
ncbi:MAG: hypothetical protein J6Y91_06700, partial [Alphaproteobacteria bacterium]|nr:hypothetical protein [Alphaproteobacteria bacterium]